MSPARPGRRRPAPASGQAVWVAADLSPADWMIPLGTEDAAEIVGVLLALAAAAPEPPMPRCAAVFATLRERLTEGRGFALLRGLAPDAAPGGTEALLGILGRHLGAAPVAAGQEYLGAEPAPGFEPGRGLRALLGLRMAGQGVVTLVSAGALHNAVLLRDRALLGELYEPLPVVQGSGLVAEPVFVQAEGGFSGRLDLEGMAAAEAPPHGATLTGRQRAAIAMLSDLAEGAEHAFRLEVRPGDLLCLDSRLVWQRRMARAMGAEPAFLLAPLGVAT